jgi:hypothetical protein
MASRRRLVTGAVALALAVPAAGAGAAAATAGSPTPPSLPNSTHGTKKCGNAKNEYAHYHVYLVKGKKTISCARARHIARLGVNPPARFRYWDWTKGGNGPWSDVWSRKDNGVVIGGILYDY